MKKDTTKKKPEAWWLGFNKAGQEKLRRSGKSTGMMIGGILLIAFGFILGFFFMFASVIGGIILFLILSILGVTMIYYGHKQLKKIEKDYA